MQKKIKRRVRDINKYIQDMTTRSVIKAIDQRSVTTL